MTGVLRRTALAAGSTFPFRTVAGGQPGPNQDVQYGGRTASGARIAMRAVRSNADGVAEVRISQPGTCDVEVHCDGTARRRSRGGLRVPSGHADRCGPVTAT